MTIQAGSLLFADSNVFIEALFIPSSSASVVIKIIATGAFKIATCKPVIHDVARVIVNKLNNSASHSKIILEEWQNLQKRIKLKVLSDPPIL